MKQTILSKNNTQTKTETDHGQEEHIRVPKGERRGRGMDGHIGSFLDANSYIWNR